MWRNTWVSIQRDLCGRTQTERWERVKLKWMRQALKRTGYSAAVGQARFVSRLKPQSGFNTAGSLSALMCRCLSAAPGSTAEPSHLTPDPAWLRTTPQISWHVVVVYSLGGKMKQLFVCENCFRSAACRQHLNLCLWRFRLMQYEFWQGCDGELEFIDIGFCFMVLVKCEIEECDIDQKKG